MHFKSLLGMLVSDTYLHINIQTVHLGDHVQLLATVLLAGQSTAAPHLQLLQAKLAAIKAPHVVAHTAVATDVKRKTADAFWKSLAAIQATKLAAASIVTAPIRVVGKTIALKVAALKAAKALKVAQAGRVVASLQRNPLIVPVPVPVQIPFPVLHKQQIAALNPVNGLIQGAHGILQSSNILGTASPSIVPVARPVAQTGNGLLNQFNFDFKYPVVVAPSSSSSSQSSQVGHLTYGLPRP